MAMEELTLDDVLARAYARALAPGKAVRVVRTWLERHPNHPNPQVELSAALLRSLDRDAAPLKVSYLSQTFNEAILDVDIFVIQLLFRIAAGANPDWAVPLATALVSSSWASTVSPIASYQVPAPPDVGTSTAANPVPTLALLMSLLQRCCSAPPLPVIALTARILSALEPYPAPPLELGVEASALLPQLPDIVGQPLRASLSGLMADVTVSQALAAQPVSTQVVVEAGTALPQVFGQQSPVPLQHIVPLLLAHSQRSSKTAAREGDAWSNHIQLLRYGRFLCSPETYLLNLLEAAISAILGTHQTFTPELEESYLFAVEALPRSLKWWKANSDPRWPYPASLSACLGAAIEATRDGLKAFSLWLENLRAVRQSQAEGDDDGGTFVTVDGWPIYSLEETMIRRMQYYGLLDESEVHALLPDLEMSVSGESLMDRVATASASTLPLVELVIASAAGAQVSFAEEVLRAVPSPPDNLFKNLASSPTMLTALSASLPPCELLNTVARQLLHEPVDENARAEDPQGIFARFGEGVLFVEALADVFGLDKPEPLNRSQRAIAWGHLEESHRICLSGWVKALFGSEGIDDQIFLSTAPRDLCWLAPSIIDQAIAATARGVIDLDALHSGLDYFSQPFLTWCIGDIIAWLCDEIVRNGLVSALHLDVLQNLLGRGVAPTVLRSNRSGIAQILDPGNGLQSVFESAHIDTDAIRGALSVIGDLPQGNVNSVLPLNILRSHFHVLRNLPNTQHQWMSPFLADLEDCVEREGAFRTVEVIVSERLHPTLDYPGGVHDPLRTFAPLICAMSICNESLVEHLIREYLPDALLAGAIAALQAYDISALLKSSLLIYDDLAGSTRGDDLAECLASMLHEMSQRPTVPEPGEVRAKRAKRPAGARGLSQDQKAAVAAIWRSLGTDEELGARWSRLAAMGKA